MRATSNSPAAGLSPGVWSAQRALGEQVLSAFASFGYQGVAPPIIEPVELYERKAGARVISQLIEFPDRSGRRFCLRPELTASIARAFANDAPSGAVARLMYSGPAFRIEHLDGDRTNQFLEIGAELIGVAGPLGDAEIISMAIAALGQAELWDRRIVLGHLGLLDHLLSGLGLSPRAKSILLEGLSDIRRPGRGIEYARQRALQEYAATLSDQAEPLNGLGADQIGALINSMGIGGNGPTGVRSRSQIVSRLTAKLARGDERPGLEAAFDLLGELAECTGPARQAIAKTEAVLGRFGSPAGQLDDLTSVLDLLEAGGDFIDDIEFDPVMGRGLQYYTGVVFEVYCPTENGELSVCGGGRYDDLLGAVVPGADAPAVGLRFVAERMLQVGGDRSAAGERTPADVIVLPADGAIELAMAIAAQLRGAWLRTRMGRPDAVADDLAAARNDGVPVAVEVPSASDGQINVSRIPDGQALSVAVDELSVAVRSLLAVDR